MKNLLYIIYDFLFLPWFYIVIRFFGLFNSKIKKGLKGRKNLFKELSEKTTKLDRSKKLIWFHSSSLGEFEQAKPIIEKIKSEADVYVLVSFFSPSGYENSLRYSFADIITYLPFDRLKIMKWFIKVVDPAEAILMRYDIWPNMIKALDENQIPVFLVDATMRKNSRRKLPLIKSFHKYLFNRFKAILTISESDKREFEEFDVQNIKLTSVGDTRFDRVYQRSLEASKKNLIKEEVLTGKKVLVAGSTWEQDEDIIFPAFKKLVKYNPDVLMIIAPHEPTISHLEKLETEFNNKIKSIRFSHLNNYSNEKVIIVDSIGILLTLYNYADAAFIGGSFKQNVHNVLEAAVYGIPVLFGPKINNSQEAKELLRIGAGIKVENRREAFKTLRTLFSDEKNRIEKGKLSADYVSQNIGATEKITKELLAHLG